MINPARIQPPLPVGEKPIPRKTHVIENAHTDDIHGLIKVSENCFASGSKDGSLKVWDLSGRLISQVSQEAKREKIDYRKWITALSSLPHNRLVSGTRHGFLFVHDKVGDITRTFQHEPKELVAGCKDRNQTRITCLAALNENEILIGVPTGFTRYNLQKEEEYSSCKTSQRDWVYCLHPLSDRQVLAATGTELEIWEGNRSAWTKTAVIQSEKDTRRTSLQRPFISAIQPLTEAPNLVAIAVFDGSVRVRDITTATEIAKFTEHRGRTWSVVNIDREVLASCADDATVKLWDVRQKDSVLTLAGHPGRVSSLLPLENHKLITASCPDQVWTSAKKAELAFWDLR